MISSASELLHVQSKLLADYESSTILVNTEDIFMIFSILGKYLYNKYIFQPFSTAQLSFHYHQAFSSGYWHNSEYLFGIFHSASLTQEIQKGFSLFLYSGETWSESHRQRHLGSRTACRFSVITKVSLWPNARRFLLFEI